MKTFNSSRPPPRRPDYATLPIGDALRADWRGWHLSRKADGVCVRREWNGCAVWGDSMRDGRLMVWEIDRAFNQDVRPRPWADRAAALEELFSNLDTRLNWHRCPSGSGVEFIEAMIAAARADNTPDVCVAKPLDAPFGSGLHKIKLVDTYDVTVSDASGEQLSVAISYQGAPAGRVTVRGPARDNLRPGDIIEIGGTLLASGKFREPRFYRVRTDKMIL